MPIDHLPQRWQPPLIRLRAFLFTDATALLILGVSIILRGISYLSLTGGGVSSHPAEGALPIGVWAIIWIGVGVLCLVAAPWHKGPVAAVALGLGIGLNALWAASFFTATITGEMPRGWVTGTGYAAVALLALWSVWRDKRGGLPSREEVADELRRGDR